LILFTLHAAFFFISLEVSVISGVFDMCGAIEKVLEEQQAVIVLFLSFKRVVTFQPSSTVVNSSHPTSCLTLTPIE
jgi:hypothetical protein